MVPEDTYRTLERPSNGIYREKGSKFIAIAQPVRTEEEVKGIVDALRKEYYDARHHCYAYTLGAKADKWRVNDDGEPSGTAGKPIHGQLLSLNITNVLVVVIRYFGGTKLGVSGLINAYKSATQDALQNASIIVKTVDDIFKVRFSYLAMNDVMRIVKELGIEIIEQHFDNSCSIDVSIRKGLSEEFVSRIEKIESVNVDHLSTV